MPLSKIQFRPGVNRETTSYGDENGWFDSDLIRFRKGRPEKMGGWTRLSSNTIEGTTDGYVKVGDSIKYWQVSLKKSATGAQIGKVTKSLRGVYDLGIDNSTAVSILKGEKSKVNEGLVYEIITEGFLDNIKAFATKAFNTIKSKFNTAVSSFRNKFLGGLQKAATF